MDILTILEYITLFAQVLPPKIAGAICFIVILGLAKVHYFNGGYCTDRPSLAGKTIIVTGSNAGLGLTTATELAKLGPKTIIMACRNESRALAAIATI